MKKTISILIILVISFSVFAQSMAEKPEITATETVENYVPQTVSEKFFWALGYYQAYSNMGNYLDMDATAFAEGAKSYADGYDLTEEELSKIVDDYKQYLTDLVAAIGEENLKEAEAYLEENSLNEGVVTTASGLQYKVLEEGSGATPTSSDTVNVDYVLTLIDGTVIDSSYARGASTDLSLTQVIPGFSEGLCLMKKGASYRFWIHPSLGYGENGTTGVEPNSLLIFDVVLNSIVK
ncbi:MAG: FKBP-type peptidyl-prolyl cis-trans isomerase [Sphaerochaetaceae bacterium]|nr:FKBP-type peptidyl-prolyl cis-trans isomerase [Sphaerochaetaceae bacterium]